MSSGHVFVIEDDAALRESIGQVLTSAGYTVLLWGDASTFLKALPHASPAVIITDMRMPQISGVEMHARLQAAGNTTPVVYISGESSLQEGIEAMKLGAIDFLIKPFARDALLKAVEAGLARDRLQQQKAHAATRLKEGLAAMSPREREVYHLMTKGFSNPEITQALNISVATAKQYKANVLHKLKVQSLSALIRLSHLEEVADPVFPLGRHET